MLDHMPSPPARIDFPIGVIGAGFIVRDVQLVAYRRAGYPIEAIYAEPPEQGEEVAELRGIAKAYTSRELLLADPNIQILDIAVPPHLQPEIIADALRERKHIRGILAQKPLAVNYREALQVVRACHEAKVVLAVNQNMRYDQSIRALKTLLDRGDLGRARARHHRDARHPALADVAARL